MGKVVGIDLGTTFSGIAYVNKYGKPEIITNREGERITPSVVLFEDDTPIVGSTAKNSAVANPYDTVQLVKRKMGDPTWKFPTTSGELYTPEEISALILKRLKEDAEARLGEKIQDAVITVPAYFDDAQRKATQDAGKIAGLNVLRIINEPTAAALAYGLEKTDRRQIVLVYDLGGGTFDVTIMQLDQHGINVKATSGDKNLGGFDWDNQIMQFLNEEFQKQGGSDLLQNPILEQQLREKAENAKKALSTKSKTKVFINDQGKNVSITLTLEKFQEITKKLIARTGQMMEFVLEDAGLTWREIDKILLVGGSTRMKAVSTLIEQMSGKKPSREVDPDEAVALGAAVQGTLLNIKAGKADLVELEAGGANVEVLKTFTVKDVTAHSMGVVLVENYNHTQKYNQIVLPKNSSIPGEARQTVYTIEDQQINYHCQVTEGEERELQYVKIIGEGIIDLPPYPKNSLLEVVFKYDADGIVHVIVFDLTPKPKQKLGELRIKRTSNLDEQQVQEKQRKFVDLAVL